MNLQKRTIIISTVFFMASLLVRLAYLHQLASTPFFDPQSVGLDPLAFDEMARRIVSGVWIGTGVFELMPGYGYVLGAIYAIFGHNLNAAYTFQALLGALSITLLYLLAKRLTSESTAIAVAIIGIASQSLAFHVGMLTGETLAVFLTILMLLVICAAIENGRTLYFAFAGLITGLGALTRGTFVIFAALFAAWYLLSERHSFKSKALPHCLAFLLGTILIITPVTIKNALEGDFVFVASHGGINFYIGNNPHARGSFQPVPELGLHRQEMLLNAKKIAEDSEGKALKPSEVSSYWQKRAFQFIGDNPVQFVKLSGEKVLAFFNANEISDTISMETMKGFSKFLKFGTLPFGFIAAFALFGMILAMRKKAFAPLYLFVIANVAATIVTFVNARYRLTALPPLIIFATISMVWLKDNFRKPLKFIGGIVALIIVIVVVYQPIVASAEPSVEAYNLANAYMHAGNKTLAEEEYKRALKHNPDYIEARYALGLLYWKEDMTDTAEMEFLRVLKSEPNHYNSLNQLGNISLFRDNKAKAREYWQRSLSINPDQPEVKAAIEYNKLK